MKRETVSLKSKPDLGLCACAYGGIGWGKTLQLLTLLRCPDVEKLLIITNEPKDIKRTIIQGLKILELEDKEVDIVEFDTFDEYEEHIGNLKLAFDKGTKVYDAIGFDTLSFAASKFKVDFEDDRFDERREAGKRKDIMIDKFRVEQADWGGMASAMKRITWMLNKISKHGVYVVCNAGLTEYPTWNRTLEAAPNFQGKEYASVMAGFFDLVGLVEKNLNSESGYPPTIRFTSEDESFVCRNCHDRLAGKTAVLDWSEIIKAISS